jgi:hypothetical protein
MKHVVRVITHWALLIHIYLSMAGFTLALLFGTTGLTLNHQDFGLGEPITTRSEITVEKNLVDNPDRTAIEECLQRKLGIGSPSTDYHDDPEQIQITFAAPGRRTVATINRSDGKGEVEQETRGFLGRIDDLHKGLDAGRVWSWAIDIGGVLIVMSSLTGMVTLIALRARRRTGFIVCALGVLSVLIVYAVWVPK